MNAGSSSSPYFTLTLPNEFLTYNVRVAAVNTQGRTIENLLLCLGQGRERGIGEREWQACYMIQPSTVVVSSSFAAPWPPTGLTVMSNGADTTLVLWDEQQYRMCDIVIENYIVIYQLRNIHCTCGYTTVNTSLTRVTLADLLPNTEYSVSVAAINTNGDMSTFSDTIYFTTDNAKNGEIQWIWC